MAKSVPFAAPPIKDRIGLEQPPPPEFYVCPEYDVDFVGDDIAYAAGVSDWQSCGERRVRTTYENLSWGKRQSNQFQETYASSK